MWNVCEGESRPRRDYRIGNDHVGAIEHLQIPVHLDGVGLGLRLQLPDPAKRAVAEFAPDETWPAFPHGLNLRVRRAAETGIRSHRRHRRR